MGCVATGVLILLLSGAAGTAAAQGLTLTPLPPPGVLAPLPMPGQGGRQPFGSSGIDDPLRGLGRKVNPLDAPIQGDLGRYLDDPLPVPGRPAAVARPVRPPMRPVCPGGGSGLRRTGGAAENWPCPVLR